MMSQSTKCRSRPWGLRLDCLLRCLQKVLHVHGLGTLLILIALGRRWTRSKNCWVRLWWDSSEVSGEQMGHPGNFNRLPENHVGLDILDIYSDMVQDLNHTQVCTCALLNHSINSNCWGGPSMWVKELDFCRILGGRIRGHPRRGVDACCNVIAGSSGFCFQIDLRFSFETNQFWDWLFRCKQRLFSHGANTFWEIGITDQECTIRCSFPVPTECPFHALPTRHRWSSSLIRCTLGWFDRIIRTDDRRTAWRLAWKAAVACRKRVDETSCSEQVWQWTVHC